MASTLYRMSQQPSHADTNRAERPKPVGVVCPYCGTAQPATDANQCASCRGLFDPLSRQATQNAMGPWWVLSANNAAAPGVSYEKLADLIRRGKVTKTSIVRGPTTRQFWALARDAAGVAVLLGECHNCHAAADPDEFICGRCNTVLAPRSDRQSLGLAPVQLLPGEAPPAEIAASTKRTPLAAATGASAPPRAPTEASVRHERAAEPEFESASSVRRLRQQMGRLQIYLVILLVVVGVLVAAVALLILDPFKGLTFGAPKQDAPVAVTPPADAAPATDQGSPAPGAGTEDSPPPKPAEPMIVTPPVGDPLPDAVLIDAPLGPWRPRFLEAVKLQELDTVESVESAVKILETIISEARSIESIGQEASFPLVQGRMESLRDRLEELRLQEVLSKPGVPENH